MGGIQQLVKTNPFLAMIIANIMLGSTSVLIKIGLETIPTFLLLGARFTAIGVIFLLIAYVKQQRSKKRHTFDLAVQIILQTLLAVAWFIALTLTDPINSAIIFLLTPIAVYVGSVVILREPRSVRAMAGSLVALLGGLLLFGAPVVSGDSDALLGNGLLLMASLLLATLIIHTKRLSSDVPTNIITGVKFAGTGIVGWIIALSLGDTTNMLETVSMSSFIALLLAIIGGSVGLYLFYESLNNMRAEDSAPLFYVDPLVGSVTSALVLGNSLSPFATVAALIIVAGVAISHPIHIHRTIFYHIEHHSKFDEFLLWARNKVRSTSHLIEKYF